MSGEGGAKGDAGESGKDAQYCSCPERGNVNLGVGGGQSEQGYNPARGW